MAQSTPVANTPPALPPLLWELVEFTAADQPPLPVAQPASYTVQFLPEGKVGVRADCNQLLGDYSATAGEIDVTLRVSTLALCPPESHATQFQALLEAATRHELDPDGNLLLTGDAGQLLLRPSLFGVTWEWREFQGGDDTIVTPRNPRAYTLTFRPDGKLAIGADCNRAMGSFTADPPRIDIKVAGVTRRLCPPGTLMDRYLADLEEVSSYVFRDGELFLALPMDAGIMAFTPRYIAPDPATPGAG